MSFPFAFEPPSPEDVERARQEHARSQLALEDFRHSVQRLFLELDQDHLNTLKLMLHYVRIDPTLSPMWEGMTAYSLLTRFNVCMTCGVNHDNEFQADKQPAGDEAPKPEGWRDHDAVSAMADETAAAAFANAPEPSDDRRLLGVEDQQRMIEYHLDDVRDEETGDLLHFKCTGINGWDKDCGMTYPTIEDRMLRDPEHCSGCYRRMSQG